MNTKDKMFVAVNTLLKTSSMDKITVDEIINTSGVSRSTFYRYFKDKYDLMNTYYKQYFDNLFQLSNENSFREVYFRMVQFTKKNKLFFRKAYKVRGQNSWQQFIVDHAYQYCVREYQMVKGTKTITQEEEYMIYYSNAGSIFLTSKWIESDDDLSAEELTQLIFELMPEELRTYLID